MKAVYTLVCTLFSCVAIAGKLDVPSEMQYPNVIPPIIEFGGIEDSNAAKLQKIEDIAFLDNKHLLVSESVSQRLLKISLPTDATPLVITPFSDDRLLFPKGVFVKDGIITAIDAGNQRLKFYSPDGDLIHSFAIEEAFSPWDVAISKNKAYITDNQAGKILVYEISSGRLVTEISEFSDGQALRLPLGISSRGQQLVVADSGNNRLVSFNSNGQLLNQWGSWGAYGGQMATPYNLDIANGHIYLADQINHRLQVFSTEGVFQYQWARHPPTAHEGNGRVHYPTAISSSVDGKMVAVCEVIENRCQIFGNKVTSGDIAKVDDSAWWEKATRFHYGARAQCDAAIMAVSEPDTHSVLVFKLIDQDNGKLFPQFITRVGGQGTEVGQLIQPSGILIDSKKNRLWISDRGNLRVQLFEFSEKPLPVKVAKQANAISPKMSMGSGSSRFVRSVAFKQLERINAKKRGDARYGEPSAMVQHPNGNIYMIDPMLAVVHLFDKKMKPLGIWGEYGKKDHQLLKPLDIAMSPDGSKIYVIDEYAFKVKVFNPKGKFLFAWGGPGEERDQFVTPFGVAIDSQGDVYVSDTAKNEIKKFTAKGKFIAAWGSWGIKAGEFYKPKGLTANCEDKLIVMDFGNHRGQIFNTDGSFVDMFGISENPKDVNYNVQ